MGSYRRHVGALLRRNLLYRKRSWFGSLIQLLMPAAMIAILVAVKESLKDNDSFKPELVPAKYPDESVKTFSFMDYINAVLTPRSCIIMPPAIKSSLLQQGAGALFQRYSISGIDPTNWPVPFLKCDYRKCDGVSDADENIVYKHCSVHILALAPAVQGEDARVNAFEKYILDTYPQISNVTAITADVPEYQYDMVRVFPGGPQEIDDYVKHEDYGNKEKGRPKIAVGVILGGQGKDYEYTIRTNSTNINSPELQARPVMATTPDTKRSLYSNARRVTSACRLEPGTSYVGPKQNQCAVQYMYNGALTVQRLIDDFIIHDTGAKDKDLYVAENGVSFVNFPSREYIRDGFYAVVAPYVPLLLTLGLLYPVAAIMRFVVSEKELRQKELMKMLSISESAIELSWFISSYGFFFISGILSTITSSILYPNASPILLFFFWEFGFMAIVLFSLTVAAIFSKTTRATLVGILVFFAGYFLTLSADYDTGSAGVLSLVSLHPVAAMTYGIQIIGSLEDGGEGIVPSTLNYTDNPSGYTFARAMSMFVFDIFYWAYQMWYLNRVVPGDYGQALSWTFPFQRSYWCGEKESETNLESWENNAKYANVPIEPVGAVLKDQERVGLGVHIRGLTKTFGEKTAVDGLDLSMYPGQVFSLLGHNGAGKTTTISMLTGMLTPTNGYAVINGKNIRTQMQEIREDVGICLQHDCLFPLLTVKEHLRFFGRIKGLYDEKSFQDAEAATDNTIRDVALFEKRDTFSKDLSGGMKRKLSLAIAFCGGSKVVFLDEPTSGMDPFSRRFIWNVIRQNRSDRCIVLTTHFMDEADLLGDRIGIMAEGHLRCVGSSLFLKKQYGVGYHVTIEKNNDTREVVKGVTDIVESAIPQASVLSNVSSEITFRLPLEASDQFPDMFAELDEKVNQGFISTYGVGITTLDEVFLLVARGGTAKKKIMQSSRNLGQQPINNVSYRSQGDIDQNRIFATHVRSLFVKRAINFKRDKKAWACSTFLPVLFSLFGFMTITFIAPDKNMQPLELKPSDYNIISEGKTPFPINKADNFACQPAKCLTSIGDSFYADNIYCGNPIALDDSTVQCSNVDIDGFPNVLESSGFSPIEQNVSDIITASRQLLVNPNKEEFNFGETQYGALYFTHTLASLFNSTMSYSNAVEALCSSTEAYGEFDCSNFAGLGYVVSTNFTALHASLLYQGLADQSIIRLALNDNAYNIKTTIHPLPITDTESGFSEAENAFNAWFYLVLSFPFIAGTFGSFVVQERMSKAKHLQTVAGVKPSAYWMSSFMWDVMNYQFPLWIVVILMFALGIDAFTTQENDVRSATITMLVLFGPAVAGFTYIISFLFKSPSACNMFIIVFNFFIGLAGSMVVIILRLIWAATVADGGTSNLKSIAQILEWILRFIPSFCFAKGLLFTINIQVFQIVEADFDMSAWDSSIMGNEIIFLAVESVVYVILAIYIDIWSTRPSVARLCSRKSIDRTSVNSEDEDDEDVVQEADRVLRGEANEDTIVLSELRKQYPNGKVAVDGLSLGIPGGQVFGLLGINGAGKTTTMGILTAEFPPTSGDATLAGFSVTSQPEQTRRRIGYCPQFDAHFTNLTGREHVELYAAIKGIPKDAIAVAARQKLSEVGLNEFDGDRLSSQYSGGMKRKLSVACATIGNPQIVFLDEPSTGMDPVSRRDLWEVISNMVVTETGDGQKTSIILTTHSMEECEALCPKIGIMAGGKLKCLGSAQHLKNRFGQGYQVEVKVAEPVEDDEDLKQCVGILLQSSDRISTHDPENGAGRDDIFFNLEEAVSAAQKVANGNFISDKITEDDTAGYLIFKNASSNLGVELNELAAFCCTELRLRSLNAFFSTNYPNSILRETQDTRLRFEVPSEGLQISSLFATIEKNKAVHNLQDYGVSQTTLEQVFNMHAAAAEAQKQGTND